ncbi:hypothetical protein PENSPDRAFT_653220 [Peniophora sp. CONT]|nr:hypothetical protein PENSPDRAFT_653220 [Peniophora sp. CONT]
MALNTIICRLSSLMETVDLLKLGAFNFEIYRIQHSIYTVYEHSLDSESFHPRVDALITAMGETMNVIASPVASTYTRQEERQDCISDIMNQLFWSGLIMVDFTSEGKNATVQYPRIPRQS